MTTFIINKPNGNVELAYQKGRVQCSAGLMRITIESTDHVFSFVIQDPSKEEQNQRPLDVVELSPSRVLFSTGHEISRPKFSLCKTKELPADERAARGIALMLERDNARADESADTKPGRGKNKKTDFSPDQKKKDSKIYDHYKREQYTKPDLKYAEFAEENPRYGISAEDIKRLINRVEHRNSRRTK